MSHPTPPRTLPSPAELNRLDLRAVLADPGRKQAFVTPMFEHIAARYDDFTRVFSFGMDAGWKRTLLSWLSPHPAAQAGIAALDVGCGTGDLALALARRLPNASVLGLDAASDMIAHAQQRATRAGCTGVVFRTGDLASTGLPGASIDLITAGYAFRNAPSLPPALDEMSRVLRPGGQLLVLDFYRPDARVWRGLFLGYLRAAGSAVGWWWHRSPVLYAYIADSIDSYVSLAGFHTALEQAGFHVVRSASRLRGGIGMHLVVKR